MHTDYSLYSTFMYFYFYVSSNLIGEVCVLEDMTSHLPVIEIRIEECRGQNFYVFVSI